MVIPQYCTDQPFDGSILGAPVWRLSDAARAGDAVAAARNAGVGLLTYRGPSKHARYLEPYKFRRVETLVTFEGPVPNDPLPANVRLSTSEDAEAVAQIARISFTTDRWHADPLIANDKADAFKAAWARNDVTGRSSAVLLALSPDGDIAGFNAVIPHDEVAVIDLIAVAPGHRGRGLGRAMIECMGTVLPGAKTVRVGTQAVNVASIRLYASFGWAQTAHVDTWHWVA